jgi:hypothetical protein
MPSTVLMGVKPDLDALVLPLVLRWRRGDFAAGKTLAATSQNLERLYAMVAAIGSGNDSHRLTISHAIGMSVHLVGACTDSTVRQSQAFADFAQR